MHGRVDRGGSHRSPCQRLERHVTVTTIPPAKSLTPPADAFSVDVDHYLDVRKPAFEPWERSGAISYQKNRGYHGGWIAVSREAALALPEIAVFVETTIRTTHR